MNAQLLISSVPAIATLDSKIEFTENLVERIKEAFDMPLRAAEIEIVTDSANAFRDAKIALAHNTKLTIDREKISVTKMKTQFERAVFLLSLASFKSDEQYAIDRALYFSTNEYPRKTGKDQLFAKVREAVNQDKAEDLVSQLSIHIKNSQEEVRKFHQITDTAGVEVIETGYSDLGDLSKKPGLYLLTGETGSGKSSGTMLPTFEAACLNRQMPMFLNGSRALAQSMLPAFDERFYKYAFAENAKGVLGVVYKMMLDENYEQHRDDSEVLLIDEVEDVLDLCTSTIAGDGSLKALKTLNDRLDIQIKKSSTVVVADAFMSMNTFNRMKKLAQESGKTIYICKPAAKGRKPTLTVMSKAANIEATQELLDQTHRVFGFCDASHNQTKSAFNATFKALSSDNSVQVDGAFMQTEKAQELSNTDGFADQYQLIFANSAAKNGLSITHNEFRHTSIFAAGTVAPNDLLQALHRVRHVESIFLSLGNTKRQLHINPIAVLASMIFKDRGDDFTTEAFESLMQDRTLKTIAERIAFKNQARQNYEFTTLTMFQQQGYSIQYLNSDGETRRGDAAIRAGEEEEMTERRTGIIAANKINEDQAAQLRSGGDFNSQGHKNELESFDLRAFYIVEEVSHDLLEFDAAGKGRTTIRNHMMASGSVLGKSLDAQFRAQVVLEFFKIVKTNEDFQFSSAHGDKLHEFIKSGELKIGQHIRKVKDVFFDVFPSAAIKKNSSVTVKNILMQEFGMIAVDGEKENFYKENGKRSSRITKLALMTPELAKWLEHLNVEALELKSQELLAAKANVAKMRKTGQDINKVLNTKLQNYKLANDRQTFDEAIKQLTA